MITAKHIVFKHKRRIKIRKAKGYGRLFARQYDALLKRGHNSSLRSLKLRAIIRQRLSQLRGRMS